MLRFFKPFSAQQYFSYRRIHTTPQPNDFIILLMPNHKKLVIQLTEHKIQQKNIAFTEGFVPISTIMQTAYGNVIPIFKKAEDGSAVADSQQFLLLMKPTFHDLLSQSKRLTQVLFNKDSSYIIDQLQITHQSKVLEIGTGSGYMTSCLAHRIQPGPGKVYSFETNESHYKTAQKTIAFFGFNEFVQLHNVNIAEGNLSQYIEPDSMDAVFLDLKDPLPILPRVYDALRKDSGNLCIFLPTMNQIVQVLQWFATSKKFVMVRMEELLLRSYKCNPSRLRPNDTMHAHSGYLLFARPLQRKSVELFTQENEEEINEDANLEGSFMGLFRHDRKKNVNKTFGNDSKI